MGRNARATKAKLKKRTSAPQSPPQVQTSAASGNPGKTSSNPTFSGMSRSIKKNSKAAIAIIRRSQRISKTTRTQEIEPVIQEIDIIESDKEEELHLDEEYKSPHESSDETERSSQKEKEKDNPAYIKYKSMYIISQKKIEALLEKNRELSKNLEHSVGKVDMYEKQSHIYSEVMNVIASLCKVNENLSALVKDGVSSENSKVEGRVSKKKKCV